MRESVRSLEAVVTLFLERRRSRLLMIVLEIFELMFDRAVLYTFISCMFCQVLRHS